MPQTQIFSGLDAQSAPDKVAEDEVTIGNNIDFSLVRGAARCRRGSVRLVSVGTGPVDGLFRPYFSQSVSDSPVYAVVDGAVKRIDSIRSTPVTTTILSGAPTDSYRSPGFTTYRDDAFIISGTANVKDDSGTNTSSWLRPAPTGALTVNKQTVSPVTVVSTFTVGEGTSGSVGNTFVGTGTGDVNESSLRLEFKQAATGTNLNLNGTETIGDYGVHHISLQFDEPKYVTRVSLDYSIGDATYENYLHAEFDVVTKDDAIDDVDVLIDGQLNKDASQNIHADEDEVATAKSKARQEARKPAMRVSAAKGTFNTWSIPVTKFELIGKAAESGFTNIQSCRVIIETWGPVNVMVKDWVIQGAENYPLNDPALGYAFWETFAEVNADGFKVSESGPSPPSTRLKVSGGRAQIISTNTVPAGSGFTHRIFYRSGGFLRDAYAVATVASGTTTYVDTKNDVEVLLQGMVMLRDVRSAFPDSNVSVASPPYKQRIFVADDNEIMWSLPEKPDTFPNSSRDVISHSGDRIKAMHVWGNSLVIVNRDSVYEVVGNVFEGSYQDYIIKRSGARSGSRSPRATITTPFGILLVNDEGLFFYIPGQGVDVPITWAMEKLGDIFRGADALSPAAQKGNRVFGLDGVGFDNCVAAWRDGQLWFGYPSNGQTYPNKIAILDFVRQKVWTYSYPFSIRSLIADKENGVFAGTTDGAIMQLGLGSQDQTSGAVNTNIAWQLRSRRWTVPSDSVMENVHIEYEGAGNAVVKVVYDGTGTVTAGTLTNTGHDWLHPTLDGTFANSAEFDISGSQGASQTNVIYNIEWDALTDPKRIDYWRTPHFNNDYAGDKIFDVHFSDIEVIGTGSVYAAIYVDNTAIMTDTIIGPTSGRIIQQKSFPVDTFGEVAYAVFTVNDKNAVEFKLWNSHYAVRNEPPKVTSFKTEVKSLEEHRVEAVDFDINPGGTTTATVFVDNAAVGTYTITGTNQQSYTKSITPQNTANTFGRTVYTIYSGGPFKHYNTWYHMVPEPDRWTNNIYDPPAWPSERYVKTWVTELDPLSGTVTGILYLDNVAISTQTFTGTRRQSYNIGVDVLGTGITVQSGTKAHITYSASSVYKHYMSNLETEEKPFGKTTWMVTYRKAGGADRLDQPIGFNLDIEPVSGTATVTCIWDVDNGAASQTNTLTYTGREWKDNIPFGPEMRGYIFQNRIVSNVPIHVWNSGIDSQRHGRKGVTVVAWKGTPG